MEIYSSWKLFLFSTLLVENVYSLSVRPSGTSLNENTAVFTLPEPEMDKWLTKFETGVDHLNGVVFHAPGLKDIYAGEKLTNTSDVSELVRRFIQHVKGLPVLEPNKNRPLLVSGTDTNSKPEWCSLPYRLKELVEVEVKMFRILKEFYDKNALAFDLMGLDSYLRDVRRSTLRAIQDKDLMDKYARFDDDSVNPYLFVATHPVLIYRLVRRFAEDLQPILHQIELIDPGIIPELMEMNPERLVFPTRSDLESAWDSLDRIQLQTKVPTLDMAIGKLEHVETGIHMTALHALELGTYYYKTSAVYDLAIEWLHFAIETMKKREDPGKHPWIGEFMERVLTLAVEGHNGKLKDRIDYKWGPGVFNATVKLPFNPELYTKRFLEFEEEATQLRNKTDWNWAVRANFHRTCAGETILTEEEKAALTCYYSTSGHFYWRINPLKVEMAYLNPPVFVFHDFIGDKLIKQMKNFAVPNMVRSMVVDRATGQSKYEETRTSSQVWMYEENQVYMQPLTRKLEMLARLTIKPKLAHDAYQVASYGPSHHYEAHHDAFDNFRIVSPGKGNRIVTIMGYLSNVSVGGRTAFPVLGVNANPVKGSLVMWYNLKKNGEDRDERFWHGGCPVILGLKWITNKWVYYFENINDYPCGLTESE